MARLYFEDFGHGNPVVCLHAFALDHTVWSDVAKELRSSYRLILPDLRGHEKSPIPEGKYSMRDMGGDVISILDSLNIEKACFIGHSMGGYVVLAVVKYFRERVIGIGLVASHAYADSDEKKKSRMEDVKKLKTMSPSEVLREMSLKLTRNQKIQGYCIKKIYEMDPKGVIGSLAGMAEREDSINSLRDLGIPVGIIAGKDDQIIPITTCREMSKTINPSFYLEIEGCGHMPMMEKPEIVSSAIKNFVKSSMETLL